MLFLAVFCGFLAENQREHYVEHKRAKDFAKSLVRDLKSDTISITSHIKTANKFLEFTDSLMYLYGNTRLQGQDAARFSFYTRFMYWTLPITWNRATFEQIKNSGSLRYFKNNLLLEKLMKYDAAINEIQAEFNNHQIRANMLLSISSEIIDPIYHQQLSKYMIWQIDTLKKDKLYGLISVDNLFVDLQSDKTKAFLNLCVVQQRNIRLNVDRRWRMAKEQAVELINVLKKEYHFE